MRSGRVFLLHILNFLREFKGQAGGKYITAELRRDIFWWRTFLNQFNGFTMFPESRWLPPDLEFSTDSCLSGCGGWSDGDYFHTQFTPDIMGKKGIAINKLECLAILIAIRIWSYKLENKNLLLYCDNSSTVEIVNQGRARNHFAQSILRETVWWCAKLNCWIKVYYLHRGR